MTYAHSVRSTLCVCLMLLECWTPIARDGAAGGQKEEGRGTAGLSRSAVATSRAAGPRTAATPVARPNRRCGDSNGRDRRAGGGFDGAPCRAARLRADGALSPRVEQRRIAGADDRCGARRAAV